MEDILAILLVLAGVASVILASRFLWNKFVTERAKKREEEYREQQRQIEATRVWRESMYKKMQAETSSSKKAAVENTKAVPKKQTSYNPNTDTVVTRTRETSSSDDNFFTGVVTGMLIDSVVDSISHKSEPSLGVTKTESSWGFDDSDSRKSISDTFSSSWSSSDSSSSWSSSDSGPSSDW